MGLDAQVIAIGEFSKEIGNYLEYGFDSYKSTSEGSTVISNVFIASTSSTSHFLASCFGVGAWDLGRHELDAYAADLNKLLESDFVEDVPTFLELRKAGFKFYYLPNG